MDKYVKVKISDLISLLNDRNELYDLQAAGVDNWPGSEQIEYEHIDECDGDCDNQCAEWTEEKILEKYDAA